MGEAPTRLSLLHPCHGGQVTTVIDCQGRGWCYHESKTTLCPLTLGKGLVDGEEGTVLPASHVGWQPPPLPAHAPGQQDLAFRSGPPV